VTDYKQNVNNMRQTEVAAGNVW